MLSGFRSRPRKARLVACLGAADSKASFLSFRAPRFGGGVFFAPKGAMNRSGAVSKSGSLLALRPYVAFLCGLCGKRSNRRAAPPFALFEGWAEHVLRG